MMQYRPGPTDFFPLQHANDTHAHKHQLSRIEKLFLWAGLGSTAIALTPIILPRLGLDGKTEQLEPLSDLMRGGCCPTIEANGKRIGMHFGEHRKDEWDYPIIGVAGALSHAYSKIPLVGNTLSQGGAKAALLSGGIMIAGHFAGRALEKHQAEQEKEEGKEVSGKGWAHWVRPGTQLFGVMLALPGILPGVGHGIQFITGLLGIDTIGRDQMPYAHGPLTWIAAALGKVPGPCKLDQKLYDGAYAGMTTPLAQLCCALPVLIAALPGLLGMNQGQGAQDDLMNDPAFSRRAGGMTR